MATSGTYGRTQLDVAQVTEHAFRRATGGRVSLISAEQTRTAKENLFLILTAFVNRGLSLFSVRRDTVACEAGRALYALPAGAVDVLDVLLRQGTFTAADTLSVGSATLTYAAATRVASVSVGLPASGTFTLLLESSADGVSWTQRGSLTTTTTAAAVVCIDAEPQPTVRYWRVRESTPVTTFSSARFVSAERETPAAQLARDDYINLPNKHAAGLPLQFWHDKLAHTPRILVWQVPSADDMQLVLVTQFEVEDVGALSNQLAVPNRWLDAVICELTARTYMELPKELTNPRVTLQELRDMARENLLSAENSETDGAPIRWTPNISPYTR